MKAAVGGTGGHAGGHVRERASSQAAAGPSAFSSSVVDIEVVKEAPATETGANVISIIKLRLKKCDTPLAGVKVPAIIEPSKGKRKAIEADVEMGAEEELVDF